jgi:large subunit ribosomal protein L25
MSNYKVLEGEPRTQFKKGPARRLRRSGRIPAIIYSENGQPVPISVDAHDFYVTFKDISESTIITVKSNGDEHDVLLKDYQEDLLTGQILHIDFYEVEKGRTLRTNVALHTVGTPVGVREGGILETVMHELEVECLPKDIPQSFEVDVSELNINDALHVSDIEVPEGVTVLNSEDQTVAMVGTVREEPAEEEEEEAPEEGLEGEGEEEAGEESEEEEE